MRIHIAIELPDGTSAEFTETPPVTAWDTYRADAHRILDRQYQAATQWLALPNAAADPAPEPADGTPGWDPSDNCYCGGPEEIYPHRRGTGRHCRTAG